MNKSKFYLYKMIAPASMVLVTSGYILSALTSFDSELMYFNNSFFLWFARTCLALSLIALTAWPILFREMELNISDVNEKVPSPFHAFSLLLPALGFLFCAVQPLNTSTPSWALFMLKAAAVISALFAVTQFIFCVYSRFNRKLALALRFISGICAFIWCLVMIYLTYIDVTVTLNSPAKLLPQFALFSIMMVVVSELRVAIGANKGRFWFFSLSLATVMCSAAGFPFFAYYITRKDYHSIYFAMSVLCMTFALYSLLRLYTGIRSPEESKPEEQDNLPEAVSSEDTAGADEGGNA